MCLVKFDLIFIEILFFLLIKVEKKTIYNVTPIYFNFKGDKNMKRVLICIFLVFSFLSSNTLEEIKNN